MASRNRFCRQYLQNLNALIFWFNYLQKVNAMPSDFWWKFFFASLTDNFWSFKKRIKNFHQQNLYFFHQKSEGIAFIFCRYLYQNMRAFIFCRYCPPIVFCPQIWKTKKSSKIEGNTLGILRRSFFPFNALGMPSFNNSVSKIEYGWNLWFKVLFIMCTYITKKIVKFLHAQRRSFSVLNLYF